jgi:exonuclease III
MDINLEILDWNVRGLNYPAKRNAVREFVAALHVNLVCFQETKVEFVDSFLVLQCLGPSFDGFAFLPADDTRGGILLAWDSSVLQVSNVSIDRFALTGEVRTRDNARWWLTTVYGPQSREDKIAFLEELEIRRLLCPGPWLLLGDFNIILNA